MRLKLKYQKTYLAKKYPFISIVDFMNLSQIQEITNNDIKNFFLFLNKIGSFLKHNQFFLIILKDIYQENLQLSRNKKAIRFLLNYSRNHNY